MTTKITPHGTLLTPQRVYASFGVLAVAVVALLLPMLSARLVVGILGGIAALLALVSVGALIHLVVVDSWPRLRGAPGARRARAGKPGRSPALTADPRDGESPEGEVPQRPAGVDGGSTPVARIAGRGSSALRPVPTLRRRRASDLPSRSA